MLLTERRLLIFNSAQAHTSVKLSNNVALKQQMTDTTQKCKCLLPKQQLRDKLCKVSSRDIICRIKLYSLAFFLFRKTNATNALSTLG